MEDWIGKLLVFAMIPGFILLLGVVAMAIVRLKGAASGIQKIQPPIEPPTPPATDSR